MQELESFEDLESFIKGNKTPLLYIYSKECGVCGGILGDLENLLNKFPNIKNCKVDIEKIPEVAGELTIFTVPVIVFFYEEKEILRQGKFIDFKDLNNKLEKYYNLIY